MGEPIDLALDKPEPEKVENLQQVKADKLPSKYRAMVEDKKRMQAVAAQGAIWGGLAAAMLGVLALAFFLRVDIVKTFPRIAGAYAMVGIKTYGTSLQFGTFDAQRTVKAGRFIVTVRAQVKNTSGQPAPVPPVRVNLLDAKLQQFDTVLMPSSGLVVPARATRTVTFDVPDPKNLTSSIDLLLDVAAMKTMGGKFASNDQAETGRPVSKSMPAPASEGGEDQAAQDLATVADSDAGPAAAEAPIAASATQMPPVAGADAPAVSDHPALSMRPALSTSPAVGANTSMTAPSSSKANPSANTVTSHVKSATAKSSQS